MGGGRLTSLLGALALSACVAASAPPPQGFSVQGRTLLDGRGAPFLIRGINHAHAWQRDRTEDALPAIASLGANTVRIALSAGGEWGPTPTREVERIVARAKARGLVVILEAHDTTGYGERDRALHLAETIPYWLGLRQALAGEEPYVLVNPGNEPTGNTLSAEAWREMTVATVRALRAGGLEHTLVVDAHNWGQDWSGAMRREAEAVFAADPLGNTVFSVHMYEAYATPDAVEAYFDAFEEAGRALIVGEFGPDHHGQPVDEDAVFRLAQERGVGYLGWSYSGNGAGVEELDVVAEFDPDRPSAWGERLVDGPGGLRQTARPASVFPVARSSPRVRPGRTRPGRAALRIKGSPGLR